jgi:hypothetical protein
MFLLDTVKLFLRKVNLFEKIYGTRKNDYKLDPAKLEKDVLCKKKRPHDGSENFYDVRN